MLSPRARDVLRACALSDVALTADELGRVLGLANDKVIEALDELRRAYLVPSPTPGTDGTPRFLVSRNLAELVRAEVEGTPAMGTIVSALNGAIRADLDAAAQMVDDYQRQAELLVNTREFARAEETLRSALAAHPDEPKLLSALGYVYSRWVPGRAADARTAWQRAHELGSRDRRMYLAWADFEQAHATWAKMVEVAEAGLERLGSHDVALRQRAGFASSRLAQSLRTALASVRADEE